jgi:hypothetical protein
MFKRLAGGIPRKQGSGAHLQFADAQRKGSCQGVSVNAQCRMDPDDLEERLRRLLKKRAALHKHILARRAEKVDNTVHLQILNARFCQRGSRNASRGFDHGPGRSRARHVFGGYFRATLNVAKRASGSFSWNKHNLHKLFVLSMRGGIAGHISS